MIKQIVQLFTFLFQGAGLCRNPVTIKPADIKRPVWLLEMPKNPTRVLSAIQTAVIIASIIGFVSAYYFCLYSIHANSVVQYDYEDGNK